MRNWLMGQAMVRNALSQSGLSEREQEQVRAEVRTKGVSAALGLLDSLKQAAQERLAASWKAMENKLQQAEKALEQRLQQQAHVTWDAVKWKERDYAESVRWEAQQALKAYNSRNQQADNWIPACTADNPYGLPPARQPALDWLISLYRRSDLPGNTALERTRYILNATESGRYVHFSRIPEGDSGFAPSYQDSQIWPQSSNQVGHYLTALDISIHHHLGDRWEAKHFGFAAVIGHELWGDTVGPSGGRYGFPFLFQTAYGKSVEIITGGKAKLWFEKGGDEKLEKILRFQPFRNSHLYHLGNSIQDLRLSREAWLDGKDLVEGKYSRPEDFAQRLERLKE